MVEFWVGAQDILIRGGGKFEKMCSGQQTFFFRILNYKSLKGAAPDRKFSKRGSPR